MKAERFCVQNMENGMYLLYSGGWSESFNSAAWFYTYADAVEASNAQHYRCTKIVKFFATVESKE